MRDSEKCDSGRDPFISVIMPVRNEEVCLGGLLRQLLDQDYDPDRFEILVVDGASTDHTREVIAAIAASHRQVRLLDNPRIWSSAARNVGVLASKGELLVIVDGHCELPGTQYFRTLTDAFERSGADCLGRPQPLQVPNPTTLERAIGLARASIIGHHPSSYIYSASEQYVPAHSVAVAYRRNVFERVGLFDEMFDACEDVEFNHRIDQAGMRCLLVPELVASYRPRGTLANLFYQLHRYGRGRARLMRKHRDTLSLPVLVPPMAFSLAAVGWIGGIWSSIWAVAYLTVVLLYVGLIVGTSMVLCYRASRLSLLLPLCGAFCAIHLGVAMGVLAEQLCPSRTAMKRIQQTDPTGPPTPIVLAMGADKRTSCESS